RSVDIYGHLPPDKVLALCTGSQGEPRAALSRIAQDAHPEVAFSRGDRVIFSSRAIPGNEKAVMRVINGLVSQGIEVITDRTHLVHFSGPPLRAQMAATHYSVLPTVPDIPGAPSCRRCIPGCVRAPWFRCTANRCTCPNMPGSAARWASRTL